MVDPTGQSYSASTGRLGPALKPNLSAYSERTVAITSPDAPIGVDLGRGSFRLFPPYRSGYRLQVGSEYLISAAGRFLNAEGQPPQLLAGQVTELADPERETDFEFTNADGRDGPTGLLTDRRRHDQLQVTPPK